MRNQFTRLLALTLLLFLFNGSAFAQIATVVSNGWESSESAWSNSGGVISNRAVKTDAPQTGTYYMYGDCAALITQGRFVSPTYTLTSGVKYHAICWVKSDVACTAGLGFGAAGTTSTTLSPGVWTQISGSYSGTGSTKSINPTFTTTVATKFYVDNVVMYSNTNTATAIDLTAPTSPVFGTCSASQLGWSNGTDANTGIAATILLKTSNLNATAPVLQNQAPYAIGQNPLGLTASGADWTIVDNNIVASAISYTITTSANTRYALVHRDFAFNYSTGATLSALFTAIVTQPAGATYNRNDFATALSIAAVGTGLTYQWYSNTTNSTSGATLLSGQTNSTYTPSTASANTTWYYCIVSGGFGTVTSDIVSVVTNDITILDSPTVYDASSATNQGFTANWSAVIDATSYFIKIYQGGTEITSARLSGITGTSVVISGLTANTTYTYTVTAAASGFGNSYESSASTPVRTLNTAKVISAFNVPNLISSTINEGAKTILVYVPVGTNLSTLTPTVNVSANATVSPQSGVTQNFTSAVPYTVTAEDLSTQVYTVTVAIGSSPDDYFKPIASGNWGNNTIWQSSASLSGPWMAATTAPTYLSEGVSIQDGFTVTVNTATTIPNTIIDAISTLKATGTVTLDGSLVVNGTYEHAMDGGVIPNATWNSGSTCLVDGVTANIATGTDQNFYNFTWNCPSQIASHTTNLWSDGRHITGNVVLTTGTGNLRILSTSVGVTRSVTIDGNFTITKGTGIGSTVYTNGSSGAGTTQLNIGGDFITSTGSSFYFNNGAGHSACILNLSGNFSNGGTLTSLLSSDVVTLNFLKSGIQTYAGSGTFASLSALTVNVNNGSALSLTNNLSTTTLNIKSGAKLTNNATLTTATFNVQSDATGTGTYLDNGTSNITTANVQQYLINGRNWYVSSPVTAAQRSAITNATNVNSYVEGSETWSLESAANVLTPIKGYVATVDGSSGTVTFSGTLNNGPVSNTSLGATSTGIYTGYNLAGNPYPSYVNWNAATKTNLSNTMWYRTQESGGAYKFYTYNTVDGAGIGVPASVTSYIPPMQAFWVQVTSGTGTLGFDNTMRSHQDVTDNALKAPAAKNAELQLVRLKVSNGINNDETVLYFNTNASNGFDKYDSRKMSNNDPAIPEIYTAVGSNKLVINGMNSIMPNTEIPLGFTTGQSNSFTIKASEITNLDSNIKVYLKDKLLGTEQDLTDGIAYTFASDVASITDRFSVVFKSAGVATGLDTATGDQTALIYKNASNQIAVNCKGDISSDAVLSVYNALGQKLEIQKITSTMTVIAKTLTSGMYVVTVNNGGKITTKKVILN